MNVEEYIKNYKPQMSEYCPVIICDDGEILECPDGHLRGLITYSKDEHILEKIPKDVSPLLYLAAEYKCVIVDYENQVYIGELSKAQTESLEKLFAASLISNSPRGLSLQALHL